MGTWGPQNNTESHQKGTHTYVRLGSGPRHTAPHPMTFRPLGSPTHTRDRQSTRGASTGEGEHTPMLTRAHTPTHALTPTHATQAAEAPTCPVRPGTQGPQPSCLGLSPVKDPH